MSKTVLITGATAGIGQATARQFAALGMKLIITGRRQSLLEQEARQLAEQYWIDVHTMAFDVADKASVHQAFQNLPSEWQNIDVLVNNAGLALGLDKLTEADENDWDRVIDTNIKGLLYVTRQVLPGMVARNAGHVINLGSIAGYEVYPGGAVYCATKFAVRGISTGIKMDVHGTNIRVTEIDPGIVKTDFSKVRFHQDEKRAEAVYAGVDCLTANDIADAIVYCATRPAHVNIRVLHINPTAQTAGHMLKRD